MDNTQFAKEFSQEAAKRGHHKTLADAIGMPDTIDKDFIQKILLRYDKKHPGFIKRIRDTARDYHDAAGGRTAEWGETNKDAHGRLMLELPHEVYAKIEKHYPTMFIEKKHFNWFKKNFRDLFVPRKI